MDRTPNQDPQHAPAIIRLDDPMDDRLVYYHKLRDRELAVEHGLFIAEGEPLVVRMIDAGYTVQSILTTDRMIDRLRPHLAKLPESTPVYLISNTLLETVTGFGYNSGTYGCGVRQSYAELDTLVPSPETPGTLSILPELTTPRNVGSICRLSAGFGCSGMMVGPTCADPFYRRSIRVSMGAIFTLPIVKSNDLIADLKRLKEEHQFHLVAAVLDDHATPLHLSQRPQPPAPDRVGLLFGHEGHGLPERIIQLCDEKVTLGMANQIDSFNVATAAALFMYQYCRLN